jgi:DNA-3-methyladenine glycosylase
MKVSPPEFFERDTPQVAQDLLGKKIVRIVNGRRLVGIIAETEAYRSDDPASHSYRGKTERNKSMFGPVGHTYVYLSYGLHYCLNIVARDSTRYPAGGVLIRAIIPVEGLEIMAENRKRKLSFLISGPGNVGQALGLSLEQNGIDVTTPDSELFIAEGITLDPASIEATKRIGISVAREVLWRFIIAHRVVCKQLYHSLHRR